MVTRAAEGVAGLRSLEIEFETCEGRRKERVYMKVKGIGVEDAKKFLKDRLTDVSEGLFGVGAFGAGERDYAPGYLYRQNAGERDEERCEAYSIFDCVGCGWCE